jgi:hypothetical protein
MEGVVAVDPGFRTGRAQQPIALEEVAVAEVPGNFPAVDDLLSGGEILVDLGVAFLHA